MPQHEPEALALAIAECKKLLPQTLEYVLLFAQIKKGRYDAFIAAGFNPEQALALIIAPMSP